MDLIPLGSLMIKTFEDLKCWQACRELRLFVDEKIVPILPKEEKYRLSDQLIRASRSSTANVAEGYGRFHYCCQTSEWIYELSQKSQQRLFSS